MLLQPFGAAGTVQQSKTSAMLSAVFLLPAFLAPKPADWLALASHQREVLTEKLEVSFLCCDQSFSLDWTPPVFHGLTQKNLACYQPSSIFKDQKKSIGSFVSYAITMRIKVKMSISISTEHTLIITDILRKIQYCCSDLCIKVFWFEFHSLSFSDGATIPVVRLGEEVAC